AAVELSRLAREEDGALVLSRSALAALPRPVAAEILRAAAASLGSRAPLRAWGHRGLRRVLADAPPRRPFRLGGVLVEVSGDRVRVGGTRAPALAERELAVPGRVELPEIGRALEAVVVPAADYALPRERDRVAFDAAGLPPRLVVRARRRGRMRVSMKVMAALVVGLALVPSLPAQAQAPSPPRPSRPAPAKPDAPAPVKPDARAVLRALEDAFSAVADRVTPAVVNVST